jgi:hypothetical protein
MIEIKTNKEKKLNVIPFSFMEKALIFKNNSLGNKLEIKIEHSEEKKIKESGDPQGLGIDLYYVSLYTTNGIDKENSTITPINKIEVDEFIENLIEKFNLREYELEIQDIHGEGITGKFNTALETPHDYYKRIGRKDLLPKKRMAEYYEYLKNRNEEENDSTYNEFKKMLHFLGKKCEEVSA